MILWLFRTCNDQRVTITLWRSRSKGHDALLIRHDQRGTMPFRKQGHRGTVSITGHPVPCLSDRVKQGNDYPVFRPGSLNASKGNDYPLF